MNKIAILLALSFSLGTSKAPPSKAPNVHVAGGDLAGELHGAISVFLGIPFAAPPIGNLRWREPQPAVSWPGIRDATHAASPCTQSAASLDTFTAPLAAAYATEFPVGSYQSSEDCLYLGVFAPWPSGEKELPVMVWLHGGSNRVGSGADESYDGSSLAAHGVIVVTINYRLGAMGFFSHPQLTAESPHHSSGNYGLLDQVEALKWVQSNIAQFGGDASNVTLFGESAGSVDATTLMASPLVKGLFRRVIAESGPAFGLGPAQALASAEAVGKAVGKTAAGAVTTQAKELEILRQMPALQVAELDRRVLAERFKTFDPNGPVVDGWLLPQSPAKAFASGKIQKVDLLAGFNGRELSAFRLGAAAAAKQSPKPPQSNPATDAVKKLAETARPLYDGWTGMAIAMYLTQILMHGDVAIDQASNDILMACPVGAEAALVTANGGRAFVYKFDRSVPGKGESKLGAFHGLEIPYVFDTFAVRSWRWLPFSETDRKLSALMQTYWTNFAKTGNPNSAGFPSWKPWSSADEPYLEFTQSGTGAPQQNLAPPFCNLKTAGLKERLASN
jgi:para-nitrobenzyl esterase